MRTDFASSLLQVAEDLAALDVRGKPRQASLRRALSTAYYSLFHLLIDSAVQYGFQNEAQRRSIGPAVARQFGHTEIESILTKLAASQPGNRTGLIAAVIGQDRIEPDLAAFCIVFKELQDEREKADYDRVARFRRAEVVALVTKARAAFDAWSRALATPQGRQVALLLFLTCRSRRY